MFSEQTLDSCINYVSCFGTYFFFYWLQGDNYKIPKMILLSRLVPFSVTATINYLDLNNISFLALNITVFAYTMYTIQ